MGDTEFWRTGEEDVDPADFVFIWGPSSSDPKGPALVLINIEEETWVEIPERELRRIARLTTRQIDELFHIKKNKKAKNGSQTTELQEGIRGLPGHA